MEIAEKDKEILRDKISKFVFDNFSIEKSEGDYDYGDEIIVYCSDRTSRFKKNSLNDIVEDIYDAIVK